VTNSRTAFKFSEEPSLTDGHSYCPVLKSPVMVDFTKLLNEDAWPLPLNPADIFRSLPRANTRFEYLRDVQGDVLKAWQERRVERDIVIKMNTGSAKTLVGLLMLQSFSMRRLGPSGISSVRRSSSSRRSPDGDTEGSRWSRRSARPPVNMRGRGTDPGGRRGSNTKRREFPPRPLPRSENRARSWFRWSRALRATNGYPT
jgi:hypothetical protein